MPYCLAATDNVHTVSTVSAVQTLPDSLACEIAVSLVQRGDINDTDSDRSGCGNHDCPNRGGHPACSSKPQQEASCAIWPAIRSDRRTDGEQIQSRGGTSKG